MSISRLIRIVSDWGFQSGVKVARGASDAPRHRQSAGSAPALSNCRIPASALRAPAADVEQREPASPRVSSLRVGWCWLKQASDALDDSPVAAAVALALIFAATFAVASLSVLP